MPRAALATVLGLAFVAFAFARESQAQDPAPAPRPGGDAAATGSGVPTFPAALEGDARHDLAAPFRIRLHDGAKIGDWLERTKVRKGQTPLKERTTIAGRRGELWIIDRNGPTWAGNAFRLFCAADGRVLAAAAAKPGEDDLTAVKIAAEPVEPKGNPVVLDTAIGKVKALEVQFKAGPHADDIATKTVGAEGPFEGLELGRVFDHDGKKLVTRLSKLE